MDAHGYGAGAEHDGMGMMGGTIGDGANEPTQLVVEGMLMKLLAQSPDGTLMCCANETTLKFVDSRFLKLYETNTPGQIVAACFHPQKYELFLKIDGRTYVFDLATKEYRTPEETDNMIPPEPWAPPPPPPAMTGEKRRSGSGRPKGSKDKTQRKPRSAAAQEFEKEVVTQLTAFCGEEASKWNAKKPAIDAVKASPMWDSWSKSGLNEQQLVQFVHRLKAKRMGGKDVGGPPGKVEVPPIGSMPPVGGISVQPGFLGGMTPGIMPGIGLYNQNRSM